MRTLRVAGMADNGRSLICDDPSTGEQFVLANDQTLQSAMRGRFPIAPSASFQGEKLLPPREIQARIRAGAGVEELALESGTSVHRIERFAHPVLLERATVAEKAKLARPTIDGITGAATVESTVLATLSARGHDGDETTPTWDAHKDDESWVLTLTWQVGHSSNRASWTYHPGPAGGTLTARDEAAAEMVDPALRVLRPLRDLSAAASAPVVRAVLDPTLPTVPAPGLPVAATPVQERPAPERSIEPDQARSPRRPARIEPTPAPQKAVEPAARESATQSDDAEEQRLVEQSVTDDRSGARARTGTESARPHRGNRRPAMPSWEDVLLGTRSERRG
jgi:hypothetical protein